MVRTCSVMFVWPSVLTMDGVSVETLRSCWLSCELGVAAVVSGKDVPHAIAAHAAAASTCLQLFLLSRCLFVPMVGC